MAGVIGDVDVIAADPQAGMRRHVTTPDDLPAHEIQRGQLTLIGNRIHGLAVDEGIGVDVDHALELGAAAWHRNARLPERLSIAHGDRHHLSAVEAGNRGALGERRRARPAKRQHRRRAVVYPQPRAVVAGEAEELAVDGASNGHAAYRLRGGQHLARHACAPFDRAVVLGEREDLAIAGAEQHQAVTDSRASGERTVGVGVPQALTRSRIECAHAPVTGRRIDPICADGGAQLEKQLAGAGTDTALPHGADLDGGLEVDELRRLRGVIRVVEQVADGRAGAGQGENAEQHQGLDETRGAAHCVTPSPFW